MVLTASSATAVLEVFNVSSCSVLVVVRVRVRVVCINERQLLF